MQRNVVRRVHSRFLASDGTELFLRAWTPPFASQVVALVHGFGEHSERYEDLGSWLAARDVAVQAFDLRGHGRSAGARGHAPSLDALLDDLALFLRSVRRDHPGAPCTLLGHSMGGLLTAVLMSRGGVDVDAVVLSGPALSRPRSVDPLRIASLRLLARIAPRFSLDAGIDARALSHDETVVRRYQNDPLVLRRLSASLARAVLDAQAEAAATRRRLRVPVLVVHGGEDPLCDPEASREWVERAGGSRARLCIHPALRHEVLQEREREALFEEIWKWLPGEVVGAGRDPCPPA